MPAFDDAALRNAVKAKLAEKGEAPETTPDPERHEGWIGPGPYAAMIGGSGADLASTLYALKHTPGAVEANPLLSHGGDAGLVAGKVASTLGLAMLMKHLSKNHPTAAKVLGYGGGAALSGLAMHNMKVGK